MDSNAALHSGCGQAAGPTLTPPQRSSASSTPGTTRTTDASPPRARAGIMVRAAGAPRLRRHRASAADSNRATDRMAVPAPVAHLAIHRRLGSCRDQFRASHPPLSESYPGQRRSGRGHRSGPHRPGQYAHPAGARWCEMAMSSNWTSWTTPAELTVRLPMRRRLHDRVRPSAMQESQTGFRPTTVAISSPIGSMDRVMPSITLPRMLPQTGEPIGCLSRNGPMPWHNARRLR